MTQESLLQKHFKLFLAGAVIILLGGILVLVFSYNEKATPFPRAVTLDGRSYTLELARTDTSRARGLGGRDSICDACAMLFIFDTKEKHPFWMKDMRFPLDIVWLEDDRVVSIARNIPPDSQEILRPEVPANRVLELRAGGAGALHPGDRVFFSFE